MPKQDEQRGLIERAKDARDKKIEARAKELETERQAAQQERVRQGTEVGRKLGELLALPDPVEMAWVGKQERGAGAIVEWWCGVVEALGFVAFKMENAITWQFGVIDKENEVRVFQDLASLGDVGPRGYAYFRGNDFLINTVQRIIQGRA